MFLQLVLSVVVRLRVRWVRVRRFWQEKGVPHSPPHPVMGSLTFLQRENPTVWMRRLYNKFKTPYVGIWLFWRPALVINSPELAKRILVKDVDIFRNRFLSSGKTDPIGGLNLFIVNEPIWSNISRRLTLAFTAAKLRAVQGIITSEAKDLIERIKDDKAKGQLIDLRHPMMQSLDAKRRSQSVEAHNRFTFFAKSTTKLLRKLFRTIVAQRGGYEKEVKECKDLFDALLKIKQDATADGEEMSEDVLLAQAAILLFGGFDTTGSTLTWLTYEMAHLPQYQDNLYEELWQAKNNLDGKDFDVSTLASLPYLNAIIKGTLRKYPPMGWLDRIASKCYHIDDQLTIPAGTVLYVNATAIQMDPDYFPDPELFDPNRFMPENEKNIKPYTYMPFGEGPRSCIGVRFAYQTLRFGLASLFLEYRVCPLPNSPKPSECHVEKKGLFYMIDEKLSVNFIPRN